MVNSNGDDEWVPALEAVHLLARFFHGDEPAKATILSRLADGQLQGRADTVLQEAELEPLDLDDLIWPRPPQRHPEIADRCYRDAISSKDRRLREVPADFMATTGGWALTASSISWSAGVFVATRLAALRPGVRKDQTARTTIRIRRACVGMQFRRKDVEAIGCVGLPIDTVVEQGDAAPGDTTSSGEASPKKIKKGGKPRDPRWDDWIAELVHMIYEGDYRPPETHEAVYSRVRDRLDARHREAPDFDTVRRAISATIARLAE